MSEHTDKIEIFRKYKNILLYGRRFGQDGYRTADKSLIGYLNQQADSIYAKGISFTDNRVYYNGEKIVFPIKTLSR